MSFVGNTQGRTLRHRPGGTVAFNLVPCLGSLSHSNVNTLSQKDLASMVASVLSMGSGAYLVAKSERKIYEAEFSRERDAVEFNEAELQGDKLIVRCCGEDSRYPARIASEV